MIERASLYSIAKIKTKKDKIYKNWKRQHFSHLPYATTAIDMVLLWDEKSSGQNWGIKAMLWNIF